MKARVVEVQRDFFKVSYELEGRKVMKDAQLKGAVFYRKAEKNRMMYPAVGDYVRIQCNVQGADVIEEVLPRTSWFSRPDPTTGRQTEQGIASNFDYILLVQSLNQNFNIRRLERYLTAAWDTGAVPVIVLTKLDLLRAAELKRADERILEYVDQVKEIAPGVEVIAVSAITGEGMKELERLAQPGKTLILVGSSGIGKSTLINALMGEDIMHTSAIREEDGRGRHTTTHRQLLTLKNGAFLIDTPGMRELGMWNVDVGVKEAFIDVEELAKECRFRDCRHDKEVGCAVKAAVESGILSKERLRSWEKLQKEVSHSARKRQRMKR